MNCSIVFSVLIKLFRLLLHKIIKSLSISLARTVAPNRKNYSVPGVKRSFLLCMLNHLMSVHITESTKNCLPLSEGQIFL